MTDFLTRLVQRTLATQAAVRPDLSASSNKGPRVDAGAWSEIAEETAAVFTGEHPVTPAMATPVPDSYRQPADARGDIPVPAAISTSAAMLSETGVASASPRPDASTHHQARQRDTEAARMPRPASSQFENAAAIVARDGLSASPTSAHNSAPPRAVVPTQTNRSALTSSPSHDARQSVLAQNAHAPVQITIGRIEVRAIVPPVAPPQRAPEKKPAAHMSLDDYLKERNRGRA
jgi:hypothetical protein